MNFIHLIKLTSIRLSAAPENTGGAPLLI